MFNYENAIKEGYSDQEIAEYLSTNNGFDLNGSLDSGYSHGEVAKFLSERSQPQAGPERTILGTLGDVGVTAAKGVVGAGEAAVGLVDIPTFGRAGKLAETYLGYQPDITQDFLASLYSPAQQEANQRVEEKKGFINSAKAMVQNPSTIAVSIGESIPSMLGGAAFGKALIGTGAKVAPWVAAAIGEGLVSAGSQAESTRLQTEDGLLTPKQAGLAVVTGVGTGVFALAGGRLAQKLGVIDPDTFLVSSGSTVNPRGVIKRIIGGGISEGAFEELPQSAQEQIWQNAALDKPLLEGVPESMAKGILTGAVMGGGFNLVSRPVDPSKALSTEATESEQGKIENDQFLDDVIAGKDEAPEPFQDIAEQTKDLPLAEPAIEEDLEQVQADIEEVTAEEVKPITEPEIAAEPEIKTEPIEVPKQPITEPKPKEPTPTIPEGKKIVHEMPDGIIMDGPAHEGAVPGSEKIVDIVEERITPEEKPDGIPKRINTGLGSFETTPIGGKLFTETNIEGVTELIRNSFANTVERGDITSVFVANDEALAIGQGKNRGVSIKLDGDFVSGKEHKKPGTGIIGGKEFKSNFIGRDAILEFTIPKGVRLKGISNVFASGNFDKKRLKDGSTLYTKKIKEPIIDLETQKKTVQEQIKKGEFVPAKELKKFPELVPEKEILEKKFKKGFPTFREFLLERGRKVIPGPVDFLSERHEPEEFAKYINRKLVFEDSKGLHDLNQQLTQGIDDYIGIAKEKATKTKRKHNDFNDFLNTKGVSVDIGNIVKHFPSHLLVNKPKDFFEWGVKLFTGKRIRIRATDKKLYANLRGLYDPLGNAIHATTENYQTVLAHELGHQIHRQLPDKLRNTIDNGIPESAKEIFGDQEDVYKNIGQRENELFARQISIYIGEKAGLPTEYVNAGKGLHPYYEKIFDTLFEKQALAQTPKQITTQLNKDLPGHDIQFDGSKKLPNGKTLYSFTPQSGEKSGQTFSTFSLNPEEIKASFNKIVPIGDIRKPRPKKLSVKDANAKLMAELKEKQKAIDIKKEVSKKSLTTEQAQTAIDKAKKEIGIIERYPDLSDDPKQEIAEFQKVIDDNDALLQKEKKKGKTIDLHKTKKQDKVKSELPSVHRQRLREVLGKIGDAKSIKIIHPKTKKQKVFTKIGETFGLNIVLFNSTDPIINNVNGFTFQKTNTIYVNQKSKDRGTISVIGHETMHQLADRHPDLYNQLIEIIGPNTKDYQKYFDAIVKRRRRLGTKKITGELSQEIIFEEFVSDFAGDQFQDPKFWQKLNKENPGLVDKLIEVIQDIIRKMKNITTRVEQNILDIEGAQDALVKAMGEFAVREKGKAVKQVQGKAELDIKLQIAERPEYGGQHQAPINDGDSKPLNNMTDIYPGDIYSFDGARFYGDSSPFDQESINILSSVKGRPNKKIKIYRAVPNANYDIDKSIKKLNVIQTYYFKFRFFPLKSEIVDSINESDEAKAIKDYDEGQQFILDKLSSMVDDLVAQKKTGFKINEGDWVSINRKYAVGHGQSALNNKYKITTKTVPAKHIFTDGNSIHEQGYDPGEVKLQTTQDQTKITEDLGLEPDTFTVEDNSSLVDDFQYNIVDELASVSKVYKAIKKDIPEEIDFKLKEELRVSQTEDEISEAKEKYDKPIQKIIADSDTVNDVSDVDEYLYARHAPEANERLRLTNARYYLNQLANIKKSGKLAKKIKSIDAKFELEQFPTKEIQEAYRSILEAELQDAKSKDELKVKKDWETFSLKPSGITDVEAKKLTTKWAGDKDQIAIAKIFDDMNADTLKVSFDSGRMSKETYDAVKGTFDFYAPLHREGFEKEGLFSGVSGGLKNLGKDVNIRGGSTKRAVNLLLNGIANHQKVIVNAKKAEVAKAFIDFVKENPNKEFWDFEETKTIAAYDGQGNIKRVPARNINDGEGGNEVQIKVDGKIHVVSANPDNVHAMRIIGMIRGNKKNIGPVLAGLARVNRYLAMINTTFNPEFIISNFLRDLQTGFFNLTDTEVAGMKGKIFKSIPSTLKALHSVTRGDSTHELASMAKRYKKAGGQIGWIDYNKGIESRAKKFEGEIDLLRDGFVTKKTINSLINWVMDYNSIVENGIRLATFKAGVDSGLSDAKAAIMAKDLTVNFNRKGAMGPAINSLYLFANAGIQGSTRLFRAIKNNPKQMSKLLGGTMLAAAGMAVANSAVGGDDEEGKPYYDRVPDHVKARNMIFMLPGSTNKNLKFIKIPSPWGYNVFWAIGTEVGDAFVKDDYDPLEGASRMAATALDAFNPLQSATLLQTMSPTIADPFVMVGENKTFYGAPLAPEGNPFSKTPRPDSEKYWRSARKTSVFVAKSLNKLTGGDEVTPSKIADISPETLDLIYDTMTGGAGKFIANTLKLPGEIVKGEFKLSEAPFTRRVIGKKSEHKVISDYNENTTHVYRLRESLKTFPEKAKELRRDRTFTLIKLAKATDKKIRKLNKLIKKTKKQDVKDKINNRKEKLRRNFNNKFLERK